ncbi:MAG: SOS response-associated peptidase family protein [Planctomycetes bacterium]|nr:SOS response-associated peptidase family protein [Planctomycetota bacterium]
MDALANTADLLVQAGEVGAAYAVVGWRPRAYIRPGGAVLAVFHDQRTRRVGCARWGWDGTGPGPRTGPLLAHGPCEALARPPLSAGFPRRRCLVLATAWMQGRAPVLPTIVQPLGAGVPFAVAALWSPIAIDGRATAAVVLLTVPACSELRAVAQRQLAVVPREHLDQWLDGCTPQPALRRLLVSHQFYEAYHHQPDPGAWRRLTQAADDGPDLFT